MFATKSAKRATSVLPTVLLTVLLAASAAILSGAASAQSAECPAQASELNNQKANFEDFTCLNSRFTGADRELNKIYGVLAGRLDRDGRARLNASQLAWLQERNDQCAVDLDNPRASGHYVNLGCAAEITIQRASLLVDRLAECESGACDKQKL
jgi:uncharacterized protein YecT (DUF1311 family)